MSPELMFAIKVARKAGAKIMEARGMVLAKQWKSADDFKTELDDELDFLILKKIKRCFPKHNIISEESPKKQVGSSFTWVVDGLDGTKPFARGFSDWFSVQIALLRGKTPVMSVIFAPALRELYTAEHGQGAFLNGKPIHAGSEEYIQRGVIALDTGKPMHLHMAEIARRLIKRSCTAIVANGCTSVAFGMLASGRIDAVITPRLGVDDLAPGAVLCREAGALVTTLDGQPWKSDETSVLAANPKLHANMIKLFSGIR